MPEDSFHRVIVTQAWQIALLTVIVGLVVRMFAAEKPQVACWLWLIVVVKCVTPPVWGHSFGLFSQIQSVVAHNAAVPDQVVVHAHVPEVVVDSEFAASSIPVESDLFATETDEIAYDFDSDMPGLEIAPAVGEEPDGVDVWAFAVWLVIAGGTASLLWLTFKFAWCLRRIYACRVTEFNDEIEPVVVALAKELRLRRVPRVIISDVRFGPAVLGIFRHLIVLPRCLIADEGCRDLKTLRPILAHELLHIRRGDLLTGTLQAAVQCLWWFHPAVWVVNRFLSRETERSCDEQVVSELGCSPLEYARSLLAVIECKHSLRPVPVFPGMKPVEITSQRMERIMSLKQGCRTRMPLVSFIAIFAFATVVLPGGAKTSQATQKPISISVNDERAANRESKKEAIGQGIANSSSQGSDEKAEQVESGKRSTALYEMTNNGKVVVVGAVTMPLLMDIPDDRSVNVLSAIAKAGGLKESAGSQVVVRRPSLDGGEDTILLLKLNAEKPDAISNVPLVKGDLVFVEHDEFPINKPSLTRVASFDFNNTPVFDALREIAKSRAGELNIVVETDSIDYGTGAPDRRITLSARDASIRSTLKEICLQVGWGLRWGCEREGNFVKFFGPRRIEKIFEERSYPVADFVVPVVESDGISDLGSSTLTEQSAASVKSEITRLAKLIQALVEPDTWGENGWQGNLEYDLRSLSFTVRQTAQVHDRILELLNQLRTLHRRQVAAKRQTKRNSYLANDSKNPDEVLVVTEKPMLQLPTNENAVLGVDAVVPGQLVGILGTNGKVPLPSSLQSVCRKLPYSGKVVVERANVHSGGGELFYPTSTLGRGSVVRVLREDPNGWLMIEPPEGSFSWVPTRYVRPTTWGNGEILNSNTVVFVGSALKQELDVWQVRMDAGETVAIFDEQQMSTKTGLTQMLKIQPPTGEYRWIKSSALIPTDEAIRIVEPHPGPRFDVEVYPVDDLVSLLRRPVAANNDEPPDSRGSEKEADLTDRDFASLIELITTTVEPGSWDIHGGPGRLVPNVNTRSLVIRQRPYIHDTIVELLGQVRRLKGQQIVTSCELLIFKTPQQIEWLMDNLKFRQRLDTAPRTLVPTSGANNILKTAKQHSESISYAPITAFAGIPASLKLTGREKQFLNLNLEVVPLEGHNLIVMEYGVSLAGIVGEKLPVATCVMGNNQTLLVDVSDTRDDSTFRAIAVIRPSIVEGQNREQ